MIINHFKGVGFLGLLSQLINAATNRLIAYSFIQFLQIFTSFYSECNDKQTFLHSIKCHQISLFSRQLRKVECARYIEICTWPVFNIWYPVVILR